LEKKIENWKKFHWGSHGTKLSENGINVNRMFISRILRSWRWSWKIPVRFHLYKYTKDNIDRYMHWVHWIQDIPWDRLKFLDEAHFIGRKLYRNYCLAPIGQRVVVPKADPLQESYSLTLLISLNKKPYPFIFNIRTESNNQVDFLQFVRQAIIMKQLVNGATCLWTVYCPSWADVDDF